MPACSRFTCVTLIFVASLLSSNAHAKTKPQIMSTKIVNNQVLPVDLTKADCTDLGGSVATDSVGVCNSKSVCHTVDQNGKSHWVCISK
jgi:hypothetical protein